MSQMIGGNQHLLVRAVGDEILILDTGADQVHQLNASASRIWQLHEQGLGAAAIADILAADFAVQKDVVERDVDQILAKFRELNLIG